MGEPTPLNINTDRTPLTLDQSTRTLYNCAITDPSSLTDQERRLITRRPPLEEEDTLCRNACGLSMAELIAKAIDVNGGLTYKEARLLTAGVVQGQPGRLLSEAARLSPKDRDLTARAMAAARTEDVRAAREVAQRVQQRWTAAELAAAETLSDGDARNIKFAMRVPWQERVLASSGSSSTTDISPGEMGAGTVDTGRFGLVVFYDSEDARVLDFKTQIETAVHHGLHYSAHLVKEETFDRFTLHWVAVPGDNLNPSALRNRFSTMLRNHEVPLGLRPDAFLYVDEEALRSRETARPYIWLAEPKSETETGTGTESESKPEHDDDTGTGTGVGPEAEAEAEAGQPLKVDIKHIAPTLFARLVQRDLEGEAKRKPYRHTSELSMLHAAARQSRDAQWERDGIWPPPARLM